MNNNFIKSLFVIISIAALLTAGDEGRNGTSAASQLLIPQGAQFLSGGGAVANAVGLEAAYWNPAGLSRGMNNIEALFSNRAYIADININYFGAAMNYGGGTVGLTARIFDIGDINVTDEFNPDGTGGIFSPSVFVVGATYSKLLTNRTSVGISVNYLNESFQRVGTSGLTFDAGVQYDEFLDIEGLGIGVALRNFGNPMQYDGSALWVEGEVQGTNRKTSWYKVEAAEYDVPFLMDIGASYAPTDLYALGITYQESNYGPSTVQILGEYNLGLGQVRFGYLFSEDQDDLENMFADYSIGGTLDLSSFIGQNIKVDYAYFPTEFFDANQIFTIRVGF